MVKKLAGKKANEEATEEDLRFAMRTIKQRFIVGLTNEMEESINRFNVVMGINDSHWRHRTCMKHFFGNGEEKSNSNEHPEVS